MTNGLMPLVPSSQVSEVESPEQDCHSAQTVAFSGVLGHLIGLWHLVDKPQVLWLKVGFIKKKTSEASRKERNPCQIVGNL